ncbi:MAG: glycosyltransferase family 4 protein [Isosphaeraceae bacterium]|nr:glycosyltransferase family 4 protein [Isosphaeraceae bacterium]
MNIGHYMPGIWDRGGVGAYLLRVGRAQRASGHKVTFLDSLDRYAEVGDPGERPVVVEPRALGARAKALGLDVLHLHAGVPEPPAGGPRVVRTVHDHRPYCPSGGRYLKRTDTPCDRAYSAFGCFWGHVVDRCGSVRPAKMVENFTATWDDQRVLAAVPSIAISRFVKEQMIRSGYDGGRIHVVTNPAPPVRPYDPPPRTGSPRFVFIGRLVVHKGLQWLLRALARAGQAIALDVAGEGPYRAELEQLTDRLGLSDVATFHGWVDEAGVDRLVANARGVVFPAVWHEPAGLAALDGSARGRAVIGSRCGGLPEYAIEGQNALLVDPNDDLGLADALTRLADDWELAARLGAAGHALAAETFSLERHLAELERVYRGDER